MNEDAWEELESLHLDGNFLDVVSNSSLYNEYTGMGTSASSSSHTRIGRSYLLSEWELRELYRSNWLIRRVIDLPPKDMTKAGITLSITDGGTEDVAAVMKKYGEFYQQSEFGKSLSVDDYFQEAYRYARWFGSAYCVLRVNGKEDPEKPITKIKSVEGVTVLDCYSLCPDIEELDYTNPEYYRVITSSREDDAFRYGQKIHSSRVLEFTGNDIHPYDQHSNSGRMDSVIQTIFQCYMDHSEIKDAVKEGLRSFSLMIVKLQNLAALLTNPQGKAALRSHLQEIVRSKSLHKIIPSDAATGDLGFEGRNFGGVNENYKTFIDELTAASELPFYKLWGTVGKAALADSGGAETRAYAELVKGWQESKFRKNHQRILKILLASELGKIPEQWSFEYNSIYEQTPEEQIAIKLQQAQIWDIYSRLPNAVLPKEFRQAIASDETLPNVINLDEDPPDLAAKQLEEQKKQQAEALAQATGQPIAPTAPGESAIAGEQTATEPIAPDTTTPESGASAPLDLTEFNGQVAEEPTATGESAKPSTEGGLAPATPEATVAPTEPTAPASPTEPIPIDVPDVTQPPVISAPLDFTEFKGELTNDDAIAFVRTDAPAKKGRGKNCNPAVSRKCGNSCVSLKRTKGCKDDLTPDQKKKARSIKQKIVGGTGASAALVEEPTPAASVPEPAATPVPPPVATEQAIAPTEPVAPATPEPVPNADPTPTLQAKQVNPNAIPDLTTDDYRQYVRDSKFLVTQNDPSETFNQTRAATGLNSSQYKSEILNAIASGHDVSDGLLTSEKVKLTKAQRSQLEANRSAIADKQANVARIDRAKNTPLTDSSLNHRPNMSRDEAMDYVKDSYFAGVEFHHGNKTSVVDSIQNDGADPTKNDKGIYGQGVYFAVSKADAQIYADAAMATSRSDTGIISSAVRVQNPYISDSANLANLGSNFAGEQSNGIDSEALSGYLKAKGYDSIYVRDLGYFVAMDQRQVVTFNQDRQTFSDANLAAGQRRNQAEIDKLNSGDRTIKDQYGQQFASQLDIAETVQKPDLEAISEEDFSF